MNTNNSEALPTYATTNPSSKGLVDQASSLFATSQGSLVTLWHPCLPPFVPPVGLDPSLFKNSAYPVLSFDAGFEVCTMAFTPKFDCLAVLGCCHRLLALHLDFASPTAIDDFLNFIPQHLLLQDKFKSPIDQQYLPHPLVDAVCLSEFSPAKRIFQFFDIRNLLMKSPFNLTD
ncbi:hypothetical protein L0F63_001082 [Massospora cicadina]|nr:hypothetical protein L0F63_001082 [Massospora cicadina]